MIIAFRFYFVVCIWICQLFFSFRFPFFKQLLNVQIFMPKTICFLLFWCQFLFPLTHTITITITINRMIKREFGWQSTKIVSLEYENVNFTMSLRKPIVLSPNSFIIKLNDPPHKMLCVIWVHSYFKHSARYQARVKILSNLVIWSKCGMNVCPSLNTASEIRKPTHEMPSFSL